MPPTPQKYTKGSKSKRKLRTYGPPTPKGTKYRKKGSVRRKPTST
jgi:hypothetical protein